MLHKPYRSQLPRLQPDNVEAMDEHMTLVGGCSQRFFGSATALILFRLSDYLVPFGQAEITQVRKSQKREHKSVPHACFVVGGALRFKCNREQNAQCTPCVDLPCTRPIFTPPVFFCFRFFHFSSLHSFLIYFSLLPCLLFCFSPSRHLSTFL